MDFMSFNLLLGKLRETLKGRNLEYSFQIECSDEK